MVIPHTPANTLVISSTRIPVNGNVVELTAAWVARPRGFKTIKPLRCDFALIGLTSLQRRYIGGIAYALPPNRRELAVRRKCDNEQCEVSRLKAGWRGS